MQVEENALKKCTQQAFDADTQATSLHRWQQQYDQLGEGAFYGVTDLVEDQELQFFREQIHQATQQECQIWSEGLWIGFPALGQQCRINGLEVENQLMLHAGAASFALTTPNHFQIYGLVIQQEALATCAAQQQLPFSEQLWQEARRQWSEQEQRLLQSWIEHHLHGQVSQPQLDRDQLYSWLLLMLSDSEAQPSERPSYARRKATVDQVCELLRLHPETPLSMSQLCALTHTSRRTLQYSFETILGISPLRYLRMTRLNQVRRRLVQLATAGEEVRIYQVAAEWGFWHPGQFALDYKTLFGESPSLTLAQHMKQAHHSGAAHHWDRA